MFVVEYQESYSFVWQRPSSFLPHESATVVPNEFETLAEATEFVVGWFDQPFVHPETRWRIVEVVTYTETDERVTLELSQPSHEHA